MKIKSVGEFEFIERVKAKTHKLKNAVLGIGDDCAVLPYSEDKYLLWTQDMLLEDVHFDLSKVSAFKVGRKALAVSLSDIAAMGGIPKYAVLSLGIPEEMLLEVLDDFYSGLLKLAYDFDVELIGGDTNFSEKFICDLSLIGEVEKKLLVKRSGAKVKDGIFVTGSLGGSIKGKQYDFMPRVKEARILVENFKINSMIDISDGLALDLTHITDSSKVGAIIYDDSIPISQEARSKENAFSDGEDFELLFTVGPSISEEAISEKLNIPVRKIGEIVARSEGVKIGKEEGKKAEFKKRGYKHF